MQFTPSQAAEHLKESIASYIESQYRISHPLVFAERSALLREHGVIAQDPFIEATPAFAPARLLRDLQQDYPDNISAGLARLVEHGVPVDRFPLYTHQEEALLASFGDAPNLLVATGTGSGKTEAFVLPILARILKEARTWSAPKAPPDDGFFDPDDGTWHHSRRHETREAGLRAIILYPINALVNDQMSRLRRVLSLNGSPDWQRQHLDGNLIHFGMYTSLTPPTRGPEQSSKRREFEEYKQHLEEEWESLGDRLRSTGNWPATGGPEMLCRWDMQGAAPDILVTNYSMLEYMLIRPIESPIFDMTRAWLEGADDRVVTLVLDEAHTYTGAKGTEVAHLVRRLKERLGIRPDSNKFRAIATSASIPNVLGAEGDLTTFTSDLFGEPQNSFTLMHAGVSDEEPNGRDTDSRSLRAFAQFHDTFLHADPWPSMRALSQALGLAGPNEDEDPQVALHQLLSNNEDLRWVRARTARNATRLSELAQECWPKAERDAQERAIAGLLAAGSYARPMPLPDTPPILSMRLHAFFRGLPGLWACLDPNCPEVPEQYRGERPVGRIYTDPRPWCSERCGARVLEVFSCRRCGLLFVGGIPDSGAGSLWPWSDDFSGEPKELTDYRIFGVEQPHHGYSAHHRSFKTTLTCGPQAPFARPSFGVNPTAKEPNGSEGSPFPTQCPRCQNYRRLDGGREIIEPLRTRGPRSISVVMEDTLRVQPDIAAPNGTAGRKALVFSDSRQDAAQLAGDLRRDHRYDVFRQLLYRVLHRCRGCGGSGVLREESAYEIGRETSLAEIVCDECGGAGYSPTPRPIPYRELRSGVIDLQIDREINPTDGHLPDAFERLEDDHSAVYAEALVSFDIAARREIAQGDIGLEPLGLAMWSVNLPERTGQLEPLSQDETHSLLRTVARILATEHILLPPEPLRPWEWPFDDRMQPYERQRIVPANRRQGDNIVPYNLQPQRKLGRYVRAVARRLLAEGRIQDVEDWLDGLRWPLWNALKGFRILVPAGRRVNDQTPHGIRIDSFELRPVGDTVFRCAACSYVMGEVLLGVCYRCGQTAEQVEATAIQNFFRRSALFAKPGAGHPDKRVGATDSDFTVDSIALTFNPGETEKIVTFSAVEDTVDDDGESVTLSFGTLPDGIATGIITETTVSIIDDDSAGVSIDPTTLTIGEGASDTYTVALDTQPSADVTVTISGHAGTDVSLSGGTLSATNTLTFTDQDWDVPQTVTVTAEHDDDAAAEAEVTLSHAVTGASEYAAIDAADVPSVSVTITEDDSAGVTISRTTLTINEGGSETYTVALNTEPSADVTVTISGHTGTDVSLSDTGLDFTTGNWDTAQTVTVTAGQDDDAESEADVTLTHAVTGASEYAAIAADDVPSIVVTITEDDSAGVTIDPTALTVLGGQSNTYTVVLATQPSADVTVTISGHAGTDVSLSGDTLSATNTLTFTADNWSEAQTVTLTAGDVAANSGVHLSHAVGGGDYGSVTAEDVTVSIVAVRADQVTIQVGVTGTPVGLTVPEGGSVTYEVLLSEQPTGDVTLTITVEDTSNNDVSTDETELVLTTGNWNTAQSVTVRAAHDDDAVQDPVVNIGHTLSGANSDDVEVPGVEVTIIEDDSAGVTISESRLTIDEGGSETYTVALNTEPSADVTVTISGHTGTDVTLDKIELDFTTGNWDTAQTVTVTAEQDDDAAADTDVTLTHAMTGASEYAAIDAATVPGVVVKVTEDDSAGVTISRTTLTIGEGRSDTYTVVLNTQPSADVTVTISGHTGTDVSLSDTELNFTPGNWDTAQTVTVTAGQDDDAATDTDVTLTHAVTGASEYAAIDAATVPGVVVKVTEDDSAGVAISRTTLTIGEGASDTYTVALDTQPSADVTVTISGHSGTDVSLSDTELDFTPGNWDTAQTVTVTAGQDDDATGDTDVTLTHAVTGASEYAAIAAADVPSVAVRINEDDSAGVTISRTTLTINEGGSETYTVALNTEPSADVTVTISGHSGTDVSLSDTGLDFTPGNWDTAQTVTVTAGQDDDATGDTDVTLTHAVTGASEYAAIAAADVPSVAVRITEDDSAGVTISRTTLTIGEGGSDTYTVVLDTEPSADVTVTISGHSGTDVRLSDTELNFTPGNWDTAQTVTVTAGEDDDATADTDVTLTHTVTGASEYAAIDAADVPSVLVTINEDDSAGVTISKSTLTIDEGGSETYTVALNTEPSADVTVTISGHSGTDVRLSDTELNFTPGNWDTAQTVTVTAGEDDDATADTDVTLTHAVTGASEYAAIDADDVPSVLVKVTEDDSAGVAISRTTLTINEGGSDTYTVALNTEPSDDVTVTISGHSGTDVRLSDTELDFTPGNWDTAQTVTVTAEHDDDAAADTDVTLTHAVTGASEYAAIDAATVPRVLVKVTEDDSAGVAISRTTLTINEGGSDTYTVALNTQPSADVTVTVSGHSGTDVTLDDTELDFTPGNWDTAQTVTVTAGEDDDATADTDVTLTHAVTGASEYAAIAAADVPSVLVTINEHDSAGVKISKSTLIIAEGGSDTYTVVLTSEPAGEVKVTLGGHAGTDLSLDKTELTFTRQDWNVPQTVTVTAGEDDTAEVTHTVSSTEDSTYNSLPADKVTVRITHDDSAGVTVSYETSAYELREGSDTEITVVLSNGPSSQLTIRLSTVNQSGTTVDDYSGVPLSVTFAIGETEKPFTFIAVQDEDDENAEDVTLGFDSLPTGVSAGTPAETTVTILDSLRVSFSASRYEAYEGGTGAAVIVNFDSAVAQETVIPITATEMNGATDADWMGVPDELVFAPGQRSETFTLMAYDDDVEDDGESVLLEFGDLPAGVVAGTPGAATVELMNTEADVCNNRANEVMVLDRVGSIGAQDETNVWTVSMDPHKLYIFELIGAVHGSDILGDVDYQAGTLTLDYPNFIHIINSSGSEAISSPGTRMFVWGTTATGPFEIKVGSGDGGTGTYQIKVRVNNICYVRNGVVVYKYDGGPDGYPLKFDEPADTSTDDSLYRIPDEDEHFGGSGFLGNHGGTDPDVDWFRVDLHGDYEYQIEVWTSADYLEEHQATQLKILGIRDKDGNAIDDTSSPTSGKNVSVDFRPTTTGRHYLSVGSDGTDHTGVYSIRVTSVLTGEEEREQIRAPAPQNLEAEANGDGSVVCDEAFGAAGIDPEEVDVGSVVCLTWDAPDDDSVESYQILRHRPDEGESEPIIRVEDTVSLETTFIDVNVSAGIRYVYSVKAINYAGVGPESNKADITTPTSAQAAGTAANTPATGAPTISGTALAGETLTADVSRIEDEDGMTSATFIYQWILTDGGGDAEIPDAVNSTYMVTDEDVGKPIKVRVTFTDDAGNEESLTSFGVIATRLLQVPGAPGTPDVLPHGSGSLAVSWAAPDSDGGSPITGYKVQWKEAQDSWAAAGDVSEVTVTGTSQTISGLADGTEYSVRVLAINGIGESVPSADGSATPLEAAPPELSGASVDGATLTLTFEEALDRDSAPATTAFTVTVGGSSRDVESVTVSGSSVTLILASAVTSQDVVVVSYAAPADEEAESLRGAEGAAVESFTDRSVTNETASTVPLTASLHDAPESHNGHSAFTFELRFSEELKLSYKKLKNHAFTVTGGTILKAQRIVKSSNIRWRITVVPDSDSPVHLLLPATTRCGAQGGICASGGRKLSNELALTVSGPGR